MSEVREKGGAKREKSNVDAIPTPSRVRKVRVAVRAREVVGVELREKVVRM